MKHTASRIASFLLILSLAFLCGCDKDSYDYDTTYPSGNYSSPVEDRIPQNSAVSPGMNVTLDFSGTTTIISTPLPEPTPIPTPVPSPVPTPPQEVSSGSISGNESGTIRNEDLSGSGNSIGSANMTGSITGNENGNVSSVQPTSSPAVNPYDVQITKSPTSETVRIGGSALFIAKADNASSINWIAVSPDAKTVYNMGETPDHFSGLTLEGIGTTNLRLNNIPASMNGWRIQCYFTGQGGPKYTSGAYLTVLSDSASSASTGTIPSDAETKTADQARITGQQLYSAAKNTSGYPNVTDISNYSYENGQATFSMTFQNSTYEVIGMFKSYCTSSDQGTSPMFAYVYNIGNDARTSIRGENLSGQSLNYFLDILNQYKAFN